MGRVGVADFSKYCRPEQQQQTLWLKSAKNYITSINNSAEKKILNCAEFSRTTEPKMKKNGWEFFYEYAYAFLELHS